MSPRDAADLGWPLSEGMQVSALPPSWIAMIISCWSVKLLKLPSVTLTHVCGTNSHNWWAKDLPGVVKIFYDSDSSGWKSFRLLDSDSTALTEMLLKWLKQLSHFGQNVSKYTVGSEILLRRVLIHLWDEWSKCSVTKMSQQKWPKCLSEKEQPVSEFLKDKFEMMLVLLMSCWWPQMAKLLWAT